MEIQKAIDSNKKICILAYSVTDAIEQKLHLVLERILYKYDHPKLISPIYTCVKELLMNAVKANFKNIYFEDYQPQTTGDSALDYQLALKLFKLEMSRENAGYLEQLARKWNIHVKIFFWVENHIMHVKVINPAQMTSQEINKVRQKLKEASECEDIAEYFIKADDDPEREGAGLGLVMISMMLKSLKLSHRNLIIATDKESTQATLIIPLNARYAIIE
ncbi:MAG: hypothetical protein JXA20_18495 [Spirochaetes bacterium]|nr:hypothetical protein [Spirochaetota bacterium]